MEVSKEEAAMLVKLYNDALNVAVHGLDAQLFDLNRPVGDIKSVHTGKELGKSLDVSRELVERLHAHD